MSNYFYLYFLIISYLIYLSATKKTNAIKEQPEQHNMDLSDSLNYLRFNSTTNTSSTLLFHDTTDSYVDHLYNNSPPLTILSERKPTLSRAASSKLNKTKSDAAIIGKLTKSKEKETDKDTTKDNNKAAAKKDTSSKKKTFTIQKETIRTPNVVSGLSKMFEKGNDSNIINGLNLLVYLPNRQPIHFQVKKSATVCDVLQKVLRLHKESDENPELILRGSAACYELRLHEEDGMPEEDFPALERTREVKHFGGEGEHEYCLCRIEGIKDDEEDDNGNGNSNGTDQQGNSTSSTNTTISNANHNAEGKTPIQLPLGKYIKISLPGNLHSKQFKVPHRTLRDLIPILANKQSMPNLYYETVQFEVSDEDCKSLNMMSNILDLGTLLTDLQVDNIELTTKIYADTPTQSSSRDSIGTRTRTNNNHPNNNRPNMNTNTNNHNNRNQESSSVLGRVVNQETNASTQLWNRTTTQRPSEAAFRFDALTAAIYQEWRIKKKNKWGRWQTRILGIDIQKMYNKKGRGKERRGSTVGVTNPERMISNILEIEYVDGTSTNFKLKHLEGDSTQTLEYEAETPHDCVEIVSKLKYILNKE